MSLYNMMFGYNPLAPIVLDALQLRTVNIPRFRDAYYNITKDELVIYTRTGGGNRDFYEEASEENPIGPFNSDLQSHPLYLFDEDDDFDSTYAYFHFSIPTEYKKFFETIKELSLVENVSPKEKFKQLLEDLQGNNPSPEAERAFQMIESFTKNIIGDN